MDALQRVSLLDLAGRDVITWYVLFMDSPEQRWWIRACKPGYRHVQLWRRAAYGGGLTDHLWLVVDPGMDHVNTYIDWNPQPPWQREAGITAMRVEAALTPRRIRNWFFFGPITCVETVKTQLGIASMRIRTPWQLAKYLRAHQYTVSR